MFLFYLNLSTQGLYVPMNNSSIGDNVNDSKISEKIQDHAKDINEFQDKLFNYIEINQISPAIAVGGLIACAVSIIKAEEEEDPEIAKMMLRISKRLK